MGHEEVDIAHIVNNIAIVKTDLKYTVKSFQSLLMGRELPFSNLRLEGWDEWGGVYALIEIKY